MQSRPSCRCRTRPLRTRASADRPITRRWHLPFLASPQDRAYWEVTVEKLAARCGLAVGVVGHTHAKGEPLGGSAASWALTASDMPTLQEGDVLGVWLDQGDYPVTLRYAHNGVQIPATACLSPSAEALPAVQLGGEEVRSLTATDSRPPEQPYPARPAAPPHLPLLARAQPRRRLPCTQLAINFGAVPFKHKPKQGFDGVIKSRSII